MELDGVGGLADHETAEPFVPEVEGARGLVGQGAEQKICVCIAVGAPAVGGDLAVHPRYALIFDGLAHLIDALRQL